MSFAHPEALLLLIPLGYLLWFYPGPSRGTTIFRTLALSIIILGLAAPTFSWHTNGMDLWVLVDRSDSITSGQKDEMDQFINRIRENRSPEDRLGILAFGHNIQVRKVPGEDPVSALSTNPHGTDIKGAIRRVLSLQNPERPARILLLTDGDPTTGSPIEPSRTAGERNIPIDIHSFSGVENDQIAVSRFQTPGSVTKQESFPVTAILQSDVNREVPYRLTRNGNKIAEGSIQLEPGSNRLQFQDQARKPGIQTYELHLETPEEIRTQNTRGLGAVRVKSNPRVLIYQESSSSNHLVDSLREGGLKVDVQSPDQSVKSLTELDPYHLVILNNVTAGSLGSQSLSLLESWVHTQGGGLLKTGGKRSFTHGGYVDSPVEKALPVTLDLEEQRRRIKFSVGIVIDRSGSMSRETSGNRRKIELASLGASAGIGKLSSRDEVTVFAVDTEPHQIVPLTEYGENQAWIKRQVRSIASAGGGIRVRTGLQAAIPSLLGGNGSIRHLILFADAADSQDRAGVVEEVKKWNEDYGLTVSVIALGTVNDSHASFLKEVAATGNGEIHFTNDEQDLPRLFLQDVMQLTRRGFIEETAQPVPGPDLSLMIDKDTGTPPPVRGFNISRAKEKAHVGFSFENKDYPAHAFWQYGTGRSAVLSFEVDGQFTGPIRNWSNYGSFLVATARWLIQRNTAGSGVMTRFRKDGSRGIISVEVDPDNPSERVGPEPRAHIFRGNGEQMETVPLKRKEPGLLQAEIPLVEPDIYAGTVEVSEGTGFDLPPIGVSRSPEFSVDPFAEQSGQRGRSLLTNIAETSGGEARVNPGNAFRNNHSRTGMVVPVLPLALLALLLVVCEIAYRRLPLRMVWDRIGSYLNPMPLFSGLFRGIGKWIPRGEGTASESATVSGPAGSRSGNQEEQEEQQSNQSKETPTSRLEKVFRRAEKRAEDRTDKEEEDSS